LPQIKITIKLKTHKSKFLLVEEIREKEKKNQLRKKRKRRGNILIKGYYTRSIQTSINKKWMKSIMLNIKIFIKKIIK